MLQSPHLPPEIPKSTTPHQTWTGPSFTPLHLLNPNNLPFHYHAFRENTTQGVVHSILPYPQHPFRKLPDHKVKFIICKSFWKYITGSLNIYIRCYMVLHKTWQLWNAYLRHLTRAWKRRWRIKKTLK